MQEEGGTERERRREEGDKTSKMGAILDNLGVQLALECTSKNRQ